MTPSQVAMSAMHLVANERVEFALTLLRNYLEADREPNVLVQYARTLIVLGEEEEARGILQKSILATEKPQITDIIASGLPYCKPVVLDTPAIAYFAVPKCGSSTMKAALLAATGYKGPRNGPHLNLLKFERVMPLAAFDGADAPPSLLIVRHPRERLRSYWQKNIYEEGSLAKEAGRRDRFYGLATRPSYDEALRNFQRYRQVFIDFRHHTNSIVGFAGPRRRARHVFNVSELDQALAAIGIAGDFDLGRHSRMQSKQRFDDSTTDRGLEDDIIATHYGDELAVYFP